MVIKRRLIFWLLKAYVKKWGKVFILFFMLGLVAFFLLLVFFDFFAAKLFPPKERVVGVVGSYTINTLPEFILTGVSHGLTTVNSDGTASPDIAQTWQISNGGKTYTFHLRHNVTFSDGSSFTSHDVNYAFSDVTVKRPDDYTIVYQLNDLYAPFLITVSHPIFKNGFIGIGNIAVRDISFNSGFIETVTLSTVNGAHNKVIYRFYPSEESVKVAFALGEINEVDGISDLGLQSFSLNKFPNVDIKKTIEYDQLVSLFYNTADKTLSDKRLRDALTYLLPNSFPESERAYSPLSPQSWAYQADTLHTFDVTHAKLLLEASGYSGKTKVPSLTISTLPQFKKTADLIVASWKKAGIIANVTVVEGLPDSFQIYLGAFHLPKDPDQYTLWHSDQQNNITNYKSLRVDKLLEDGRKTLDVQKRTQIYADFQKYLLDDAPASFLYFPITYTIVRK